jgi:hypothetical protein
LAFLPAVGESVGATLNGQRAIYLNDGGSATKRLFLTGAALQSAKVIDGDCAIEWFASPDLVRRLNGARF